jgi:hypothetical protein
MTASWPRLGVVAVAMAGWIAWFVWRPVWPQVVGHWLAREIPWVAQLLGSWEAIFAFAGCWTLIRDPRCGRALALWSVYTVLVLFELSMGWFLGASLALLTTVALAARPWPNRVIMARCAALAGLAVGIDAVAG